MPRNPDTEANILSLAETLIRKNGYNGFSFRDLASGIGVKSSSVHYYYPTKADLGAKVARHYTDRFLNALGAPEDAPAAAEGVIAKLHSQFEQALRKDGQMCLCGILAAESGGLPDSVINETRAFFNRTSAWLISALKQTSWGEGKTDTQVESAAISMLALFEGALLMARANKNPDLFDNIDALGLIAR
ncbi:TetR family transcriptional regulator [Roseibium hamelinense]|uniref:TetR family transcriptional regulator n=1 Tax=Roseibium hamelinense TaxID=150831 RepID=A0A562SKY1_9HYPH|nr:TetR/AcrR family transcriptional regulator [Roseibium hamelinense]MTI43263.1 TetR/AcrR family transcriptional regulator [Roseibium hamelinense]TWI81808.1 TetR family transcriptional regulator [Roseibium hamelinense]